MYKKVIKPILFLFSPDFVHRAIVASGKVVQAVPPFRWIVRVMWRRRDVRLEQQVLGMTFDNPIGLSAGFDKNVELAPLMERVGFGFETAGSVTLASRKGNERPWFYRLPKSNSIVVHAGLANRGITTMRKHILRNQRRAKKLQLFISVAVVAKTSKETNQDAIIDAKNTTKYILQHNLAKAVEINISCPNAGDSQPFSRPELLDELLSELDKLERSVPFLVKMPCLPSAKQFDELMDIVAQHNIQGVTIANLVKDRQLVKLRDELSDDIKGGLSGEPTRALSTALIRRAYQRHGQSLVIIGVGGVFTAEHAYEKIRAGASLVGMITGMIFEGPQVVKRIKRGLIELAHKDGFGSITEAVGADHKK